MIIILFYSIHMYAERVNRANKGGMHGSPIKAKRKLSPDHHTNTITEPSMAMHGYFAIYICNVTASKLLLNIIRVFSWFPTSSGTWDSQRRSLFSINHSHCAVYSAIAFPIKGPDHVVSGSVCAESEVIGSARASR